MARRPWEGWEEDLLLEASPGELPALARRLNRSVSSVRSKHGRFCPGHREIYWSEREVKVLRRLWREGVPIEDIARAQGRSPYSVRSKVHGLGMPKRRNCRAWTMGEIGAVMHPGERLIQDVADRLGRTRDAAYAARTRRGRHDGAAGRD